jgi:hypothetical protein
VRLARPRLDLLAGALAAIVAGGCATSRPGGLAAASSFPLIGPGREAIDAGRLIGAAPFTVLVFFSPDCRYLDAHEARLRALFEADGPRGVQFAFVDSEVRGSPERDAEEGRRHGYPFPIFEDPRGRLADAVGAEFAGYVVVLDPAGRVHYRGGIDSDRTTLHDDADSYLKDALDALLGHGEPRITEGKALGCALQKW